MGFLGPPGLDPVCVCCTNYVLFPNIQRGEIQHGSQVEWSTSPNWHRMKFKFYYHGFAICMRQTHVCNIGNSLDQLGVHTSVCSPSCTSVVHSQNLIRFAWQAQFVGFTAVTQQPHGLEAEQRHAIRRVQKIQNYHQSATKALANTSHHRCFRTKAFTLSASPCPTPIFWSLCFSFPRSVQVCVLECLGYPQLGEILGGTRGVFLTASLA